MRRTKTLSTIVIAALFAIFVQPTFAQSNAQGFQQNQQQYTPPAKVHRDLLVRPSAFQQPDKSPSELKGKGDKPTDMKPVDLIPGSAPPVAPASLQEPRKIPVTQESTFQEPAVAKQPTGSLPTNEGGFQSVMPKRAQPVPTADASQFERSGLRNTTATDSANSLRTQQIQSQSFSSGTEISPVTLMEPQEPVRTTTVSAANQNYQSEGLLATDGPKLRVTSVGPSSISIGKSARYEIRVENLESRSASSVIVGINFPKWIEVTGAMPSTGSKESTEGSEEPMMVWQIPIVEANATEKIMIDVTPRQARPFDIDVEWTFKPIKGKSTVEVTEPQLAIQISGPTEVQFGEKALYDVTVSNPGTGIAENVSVMLPEILGGERAKLENIAPQQQKKFQVELIARSAGKLDLTTTVLADGNLKESDTREIMVRRAVLNVALQGPPMKYAGSIGVYNITISNEGDAMARDVIAAVALPPGVEFVSGIDNVEKIDGGIRWNVGMLSPGNKRNFQLNCNMSIAGDINVDAAARGAGDLAATDSLVTRVDAVADLVLSVTDPKGPLPTGKRLEYEIRIKNRGTKSARGVNVVMHFSEGVEPSEAEGIANEIAPGQVTFAPIAQIEPGQEVVLKVQASANQAGSHRFRAQLLCEEADSHEVAEGTTRFFGETSTSTAEGSSDIGEEFKR